MFGSKFSIFFYNLGPAFSISLEMRVLTFKTLSLRQNIINITQDIQANSFYWKIIIIRFFNG